MVGGARFLIQFFSLLRENDEEMGLAKEDERVRQKLYLIYEYLFN